MKIKNRSKLALFVHYPLGFGKKEFHRIYVFCDLHNAKLKYPFHVNCIHKSEEFDCNICKKYFLEDYKNQGLNHLPLALDVINSGLIQKRIESRLRNNGFYGEFKEA